MCGIVVTVAIVWWANLFDAAQRALPRFHIIVGEHGGAKQEDERSDFVAEHCTKYVTLKLGGSSFYEILGA